MKQQLSVFKPFSFWWSLSGSLGNKYIPQDLTAVTLIVAISGVTNLLQFTQDFPGFDTKNHIPQESVQFLKKQDSWST
jgi:hypothetical protein